MTAKKEFPFEVESHLLPDAGWCPNNARCPLLVYRQVHGGTAETLARWFEARFDSNGWPPAWRYTIYDFAHFHSNTHEVLGVFRGLATVRFGDLFELKLEAGDVVILPAGVSHQRTREAGDFAAVGAYPAGCSPDQIRKNDRFRDYASAVERVAVPGTDPVTGAHGPMQVAWRQDSSL